MVIVSLNWQALDKRFKSAQIARKHSHQPYKYNTKNLPDAAQLNW